MMKNKNQQKTRHLIFYILVFYFILFLPLQRATNIEIKFKNQTTRTYFFNVTVQISEQTLNLLS